MMISGPPICQWCHSELKKSKNTPNSSDSDNASECEHEDEDKDMGFGNLFGTSASAFSSSGNDKKSKNISLFANGLTKKNFCNNGGYCEGRYWEEKNKIPIFRNKTCAFCFKKPSFLSWHIGENSFCTGKCVDFFNEMQTNSELRDLKRKEANLMDELEVTRNLVQKILEQVGPFKTTRPDV
jgi:hypothetical protein